MTDRPTPRPKALTLAAALVLLPACGYGLSALVVALRAPGPNVGGLCREHGVPEASCFVCRPTLIEQRGPCLEHGVPEALCTRCDPALIPAFQRTFDWCAAHQVPESQCLTCNPRLARAAAPPAPPAPGSPGQRLRAEPLAGCRLEEQRIVLASVEVARQVGLETAPAVRAPFRDLLRVNARIDWRADRRATLSSRAGGVVAAVRAELGQWVEEGAVVALVDSPELGAARAELAVATRLLGQWERNLAREADLVERGVGTQRAVIEAETRRAEAAAALVRAEQRLRGCGLSPAQVELARDADEIDSLVEVRAPFAGLVVERQAVIGEVAAVGAPLFTIADTRVMWALLDVPEDALARIEVGQPVTVRVHALPDQPFAGRITWVASEVDPHTRTLAARAELENGQGRLRAHLFGQAEVTRSDRRDALMVPRAAVQWEGCCNVVFVPEGERAFRPRKVALGGATATHVEVLRGLDEGQRVVTEGAFLLKTELLKGSIGAGCCEAD